MVASAATAAAAAAAIAAVAAPVTVAAALAALAERFIQRVGQGQEKEGGNDICSHVGEGVRSGYEGYLEDAEGFFTTR